MTFGVRQRADPSGRGDPVHARHADVHQHHLRAVSADRGNGGPVGRLADDRQVIRG